MKAIFSPRLPKLFSIYLLILTTTWSIGQVGINTTSPDDGAILDINSNEKGIFVPRVDITDLGTIDPITGITNSPAALLAAEGLLVYNTNSTTGPGFFFWSGTAWVAVNSSSSTIPAIESVSLSTDQIISGTTFTDVPGMSLTFTAQNTEALVSLSLSGLGYTGSLTFGSFRVYDSTNASVVGGTNTSAQSLWKSGPNTYSITTWSAAFTKKLTGLTVGNSYTLVLQGKTDNLLGTDGVAIYPVTNPNTSHATLSIMY